MIGNNAVSRFRDRSQTLDIVGLRKANSSSLLGSSALCRLFSIDALLCIIPLLLQRVIGLPQFLQTSFFFYDWHSWLIRKRKDDIARGEAALESSPGV
jgi:hypothetical protein